MTRGRITLIAALACAVFALALSGCGSDDSNDTGSADTAGGASVDTGSASAAIAQAKAKAQKQAEEAAKDKDGSSSDDSSSDKSSGDQSGSGSEEFKEGEAAARGSAAKRAAVTKAVAAVTKATDQGNAKLLCTKLYAQSFVDQLEQQGGCVSVTKDQTKPFDDYKAKVTAIQFNRADDAQVNVKTAYSFNGAKKSSDPVLNFKLEDGQWKYYIRVAKQ